MLADCDVFPGNAQCGPSPTRGSHAGLVCTSYTRAALDACGPHACVENGSARLALETPVLPGPTSALLGSLAPLWTLPAKSP